ncbi:Pleckstrin like domain containing family G member 3 [Dissostichus eleginoides]|uniref:Pleckstrin like domain containing family G member 3 n=1 Tax=Dissostichus eleginoides TaxID=100907 RepID=A0AAD9CF52_DISEL|nr:Pleckstrin like domain containing family G member 3 [Dissostichus eleginoides]
MPPLCPPPTLSITEEILEFINQSRAREGLKAIHCDPPEQVLDQPKESPPPEQTNFTCPLPPVACPSSPELIPTMQLEQETAEMEDDGILQSQSEDLDEESKPGDETITNEVQEIEEVEKDVEADEESQVEVIEQEKEEETRTRDEDEEQKLDLNPCILPKEEQVSSCQSLKEEEESTISSPNPNPTLQRCQLPTRSSHLTKRDKKIIEKIRSYYEAAAEAEQEQLQEADEDGEGEGVESIRRNSFSQIPSGLVKTSVSRFDVNGHQEELESAGSRRTEATDAEMEPHSPISHISCPTVLSADAEHDGQVDDPISSLDFEAQGTMSSVMQDNETPKQEDLNLESNQDVAVGEEADIQTKKRTPARNQ